MDEYDLDPNNAERECGTLAEWGCGLAAIVVLLGCEAEDVRRWWNSHHECSRAVCGRYEGHKLGF